MRRLHLATCATLPEPDPDAAPLTAALAAAGIEASWVDWRAGVPASDAPTLLRSTWDYSEHLPAFLRWCDAVDAAGGLLNPVAVVRGNVHKAYLLELARRGVPAVPTALVAPGTSAAEAIALAGTRGWGRVVIKPEVGAGSRGAGRFDLTHADGQAAAAAHLAHWCRSEAMLIQPYLAAVEGVGERSLVWIAGAFTHAVRKSPRFAGDAEAITGPFPIDDDERAVASAALAPLADQLLYARVDLVRDDGGQPCVMELELIEPSLFFARHPPSLERLVAALAARLGG
ncbi:MAG: hypothetical protein KBG28_23440 [Kofleriaceae bacterium]|nr:hypothetical protein [Kofleriaceae bacterium]